VRYKSGLNNQITNVIELHPYATLEELSTLAYKLELPYITPKPIPTLAPRPSQSTVPRTPSIQKGVLGVKGSVT